MVWARKGSIVTTAIRMTTKAFLPSLSNVLVHYLCSYCLPPPRISSMTRCHLLPPRISPAAPNLLSSPFYSDLIHDPNATVLLLLRSHL